MDKEQYQNSIKIEEQNSLGVNFKLPVAKDAEAFDALAGRSGACLEAANSNIIYRSTLPTVRARFAELLEAETGIERATKEIPAKNDDDEPKVVFDETEKEFFKRVMKDTGNVDNPAAFQHVADRVSAEAEAGEYTDDDGKTVTFRFDPSGRAPSGPRKVRVAKSYLEAAQGIVDAGKAEPWVAKWSDILGFTIDPTVEGIGAAISENERRKREAAKQEYLEV